MILSLYKLSRNDFKSLKMKDSYSSHKAIYSLFPEIEGQTRDFVFVEKKLELGAKTYLISSSRMPVQNDFGTLEVKEVPDDFFSHSVYQFKTKVNPVTRSKANKKIIPITSDEDVKRWAIDLFAKKEILIHPDSFEIVESDVEIFKKGTSKITLNSATIAGRFQANNPQALKDAVEKGIGKAKTYGFGLLEISPLSL